jgi:hypothetical protein
MAQTFKTLSASFVPAATGPGLAIFQFSDHPGEWSIHSSVDPAAITVGLKAESGKPESITLLTGQYLHLRGRGEASVIAEVLT